MLTHVAKWPTMVIINLKRNCYFTYTEQQHIQTQYVFYSMYVLQIPVHANLQKWVNTMSCTCCIVFFFFSFDSTPIQASTMYAFKIINDKKKKNTARISLREIFQENYRHQIFWRKSSKKFILDVIFFFFTWIVAQLLNCDTSFTKCKVGYSAPVILCFRRPLSGSRAPSSGMQRIAEVEIQKMYDVHLFDINCRASFFFF